MLMTETHDPSALVRELRERSTRERTKADAARDLNRRAEHDEAADALSATADLIEQQAARIAELEDEHEVEWGVRYGGPEEGLVAYASERLARSYVDPELGDVLVRRTVGPWKEVKDDD